MMLDCLRRNERAYWKVLDTLRPLAEEHAAITRVIADKVEDLKSKISQRKNEKIKNESKEEIELKELAKNLRQQKTDYLKSIRRKITKILQPLPIPSSSSNGIEIDARAQFESTSQLLVTGQEASWPQRPPVEDPYPEGLQKLSQAITTEELDEAVTLMNTRPRNKDRVRPMSIYRNDKLSRSTLPLTDDKGRVFVWLNLHTPDSRYAKKVVLKDMINLRTGQRLTASSKTGALLPLECGDWHFDKFVNGGKVQSSKLIYRNNEFYVACTFEHQVTPAETINYLGVDRGIDKLIAWAVVTADGKTLATGDAEGSTLRDYQRAAEKRFAEKQRRKGQSQMKWRDYADHATHVAANEIVRIAIHYQCQVVLEDLRAITQGHHHKRPKGQRRSNFARMLNRAQYGKLEKFLTYKLQSAGLPEPKKVRPAFTSQICNACGHQDKNSRLSQAEFKCTMCGHEANADRNAASNIAAKYLYWREVGPKVAGKKMQEKYRFDYWMKQRRQKAA